MFPIPIIGLSTLRHWASMFSVEKGILIDVMNLLKVKGNIETLCIHFYNYFYSNELIN